MLENISRFYMTYITLVMHTISILSAGPARLMQLVVE